MRLVDRLNSALRKPPIWLVYGVGIVWPFWLLYQAATGAMGVEPTEALEHALGKLGLQALLLGLAVTPLRALTGVNLIRYRRSIGVLTFYFIAAHLLVWLVLDVQILAEIWGDILKRPYITVGMVAFALMLPLAVTSNNWSLRKLGPRWRRLHQLVYPTAVLAGLHYIMVGKTWQIEPLLYTGAIALLLGWRVWSRSVRWNQKRDSRPKGGKLVS